MKKKTFVHKHIQMTIKQNQQKLRHIRTTCHFLQEKQVKNLYSSFMKPCTEYGNLTWGGAAITNLAKIGRSPRKAIKTMMFKGI